MQAGHARFVAGTQFRGVDRPTAKGAEHRSGVVPPPVICQITGICVSASVIVPCLPIGGAWRRTERSLLLQTLSAAAVCTGEKRQLPRQNVVYGVLPPFNGPGEAQGNVGHCVSRSSVPEPQESSRCPLFGWACRAKTSCLCAYTGRRLTGHSGRTSAVRGPMVELSAHVLRAHSCPSGGLWLATGSCCAPEVNLVPGP